MTKWRNELNTYNKAALKTAVAAAVTDGTIIGATDPPWAVELWRWEVMPGETFGGDAHAPATREMVWVESGTLTLTVAGERHEIRTGQCARFPASRS